MNPEIVKRFNVFRAKTGKYADLELDKVEFENHPLVGSDLIIFNPPKDVDKINELIRKNETASKIPMDCIEPNRGVIENPQSGKVSELNSKSYRYFEDGDVIFAKVTPCMENGNCAIADGLVNGIGFGSTEFYVFRTTQALHNIYLWYYLRQQALRDEAKKTMTGAGGLKRVPKSFFERTYIPIPKALNEQYSSVALQQIIVEFIEFHTQRHEHNLSKINRAGAMWNKIESLVLPLTFAKEKSAARRFNTFCQKNGYELTLEEVEFEEKELQKIALLTMGQSPSGDKINKSGEGIPFHQGKTYYGKKFLLQPKAWTTDPKRLADVKDILISMRAPAGAINIAPYQTSIGRGLAAIKPKEGVSEDYLYYVMKGNEIRISNEGSSGGIFSAISSSYIKEFNVPVPDDDNGMDSKSIQQVLSMFFEKYFNKVEKCKSYVALLNHLIPRYNQTFITTTFNAMKRQAQ